MATTPVEAKPTTEIEESQARAVASLPHDLAIVKMENETIMSLAAAHPRDYTAVLDKVKRQLSAFKSFAEEAIYSKPVGKEPGTNKMRYARNLSIRAAEALAEAYGFNRVRTDIRIIDPDTVQIEASFTDFQTGRVWQDAGPVSKFYKMRTGKIARHSDDRFFNVVVKAEASKRIRECILRAVPPGLRSELVRCVDEQLDSFLDESTVQKIVAQFSVKGVTLEMIQELIGKRADSFTREDRATLVGVWTAIRDGESTVAEVFGEQSNGTMPTPESGQSQNEALAEHLKKPKEQEVKVSIPIEQEVKKATRAVKPKPKPTPAVTEEPPQQLAAVTPGDIEVLYLKLSPEQRGTLRGPDRYDFHNVAEVTSWDQPALNSLHAAIKQMLEAKA